MLLPDKTGRHLPSKLEDISVPQIPKESNRGSNEGPEPVKVAPRPHQEPSDVGDPIIPTSLRPSPRP